MDKIYTVEEIAEILQLPINTIRLFLREGTLEGMKMGKHWRVTKEQLDNFLKNSTKNN